MRHHLKAITTKSSALLHRFKSDARGNVAIITALAAIPLCAAGGIAIDYSRASFVRSYLQAEADAAALGAAVGGPTANDATWVTAAESHTKSRFGSGVSGVSVQGKWLSATDFGVDASATVPASLLAAVPGFSKTMKVSVAAVARYAEPVLEYKPPVLTELNPDAADYNRVYVYCFNSEKQKASERRTKMTAVADNGGTKYNYTMPQCGPKETLSFRLRNVRNMRTQPSKWDSSKVERYDYYTDTVITGGKESYALEYSLLETVLCNTQAACKSKKEGGVIPEGSNRTPEKASGACATGKFLYYGWEDRPPEQGGSDRDYNDIRIVMECPTVKADGTEKVALIK